MFTDGYSRQAPTLEGFYSKQQLSKVGSSMLPPTFIPNQSYQCVLSSVPAYVSNLLLNPGKEPT